MIYPVDSAIHRLNNWGLFCKYCIKVVHRGVSSTFMVRVLHIRLNRQKGMVYRSCVRSAMLCGSETWCLRENEMAILRRTERAMVREMCGAKLMEKKRTEDLMEMSGLKETVAQMAKANGVRWYGHVLRRDDGHVLRKALEFEVRGNRKRGRPKKTWKMQVERESESVGLEKKDAMNRARWRVGVGEIAPGVNLATPVYGDKPGSKLD